MLEKVVSVNDYDYEEFIKLEVLKRKRGNKTKKRYYDCITAFDIETTLLDDIKQSIMYIWQYQINDITIIGRTWDEFRAFYERINAICIDAKIVTFIHNASYEWQYLKNVIPIDDVFAMDHRKVLTFSSGCIEFRCSYLWTNMSLDAFLKHVNIEHKKIEGFDYNKKRYPNTRLTKKELLYCVNDVRGLVEGVKKKLENDGDDLYTVPKTSTGYPRRIFRRAVSGYIKWFRKWLPNLEVLRLLKRVYRGGNTHTNRYYTGMILENVKSKDIASSYPFQLLKWKYPKEFKKGIEAYFKYYIKYDKACIFDIKIFNLRLKNDLHGAPYLSKDKCENILGGLYDNGRVLQCEYALTSMCEVDFLIMNKMYDFDYEISNLYIASKTYLPKTFRAELLKMFDYKTSLKGGDAYEYGKYKSMINAVYGMTVQNPLKANYKLDGADIVVDEEETEEALAEKYLNHGWLPYQVGVYCSAYARAMLQSAIDSIPAEAFVYCDTDSVYYIGDYDDVFDKLNEQYCDDELVGVDRDGVVHHCGAFEDDKVCDRFVSLGAKKYCYEDDKGLHVTTSGVNKKLGAEELGCIENYKEGFIFNKAGGTESVFNDNPPMKKIHKNGIDIEVVSNIAILPSTYTLGLAGDYRRLLNSLNDAHIKYSLHYER